MTIDLDHVIVPTRDRSASAKMLAELLGVPWAGAGPFSAVYVNEGLTLDFVETEGAFAPHHYCFRVEEDEFNAILGRLTRAGIKYRSTARGPEDMQVNRQPSGCNVYWNEPDGHQWEILSVSHARQLEVQS
jgi:catechol 2,3-dioxygenase-like lactoylglutathione lyase family enzyme